MLLCVLVVHSVLLSSVLFYHNLYIRNSVNTLFILLAIVNKAATN